MVSADDDRRADTDATDAASGRTPAPSDDGTSRSRPGDEGTVARNIERVADKVKGLLRSDG